MSIFDLDASLERAERRLAQPGRSSRRRRRSDAGKSRLPQQVDAYLRDLVQTQERPPMKDVLADLGAFCRKRGLTAPSRATVYTCLSRMRTLELHARDLPPSAREALYNLDGAAAVPSAQVAFYCFNYGSLAAMSFAAGLPWLALYQAERMRGWRPKSRGVLRAVLRARGI